MGPLLEIISKIVFFSIIANMVVKAGEKIISKQEKEKDGKISDSNG
ncbi:hypothetical protein TOTORO_01800 [Serratia phage vB_SmaS-Totoro]|nr:hypothetical protein TOTORO_01800 [Serratia phage vB_SmaS-Totoro]